MTDELSIIDQLAYSLVDEINETATKIQDLQNPIKLHCIKMIEGVNDANPVQWPYTWNCQYTDEITFIKIDGDHIYTHDEELRWNYSAPKSDIVNTLIAIFENIPLLHETAKDLANRREIRRCADSIKRKADSLKRRLE